MFFSETKNSAFYATLSDDLVFEIDHRTILFDNDKINEGGHYNLTTGIYTAPVAGIYQFFAYIWSTPNANLHLRIDGSTYIVVKENYNDDDPKAEAEGASVIVRLQAGQTVCITTGGGPYTVVGNTDGSATGFGGYLLFPEWRIKISLLLKLICRYFHRLNVFITCNIYHANITRQIKSTSLTLL